MGYVRKLTGVDDQKAATERNAAMQEAATKQAAQAQQAALGASAKASADAQSQIAARSAVEDAAKEAASQPLGTADVQLDAAPGESTTAARNKRKASYGRSYSGGVNIGI